MEISSGGTAGPGLDDALAELSNNVHGTVGGDRTPEELARLFLRAGWRVRKSSFTDYEVEHTWAQLEFFQAGDDRRPGSRGTPRRDLL